MKIQLFTIKLNFDSIEEIYFIVTIKNIFEAMNRIPGCIHPFADGSTGQCS